MTVLFVAASPSECSDDRVMSLRHGIGRNGDLKEMENGGLRREQMLTVDTLAKGMESVMTRGKTSGGLAYRLKFL